jgi:hypothetical protein
MGHYILLICASSFVSIGYLLIFHVRCQLVNHLQVSYFFFQINISLQLRASSLENGFQLSVDKCLQFTILLLTL